MAQSVLRIRERERERTGPELKMKKKNEEEKTGSNKSDKIIDNEKYVKV